MQQCLRGYSAACFHAAMRVIGIASRKGGSGKTTLSAHLAVAAEAADVGPVAVMDADPQGGLAGWWNARKAETPRWIDPAHGLQAAVKAAEAAGYGVLLIDTPPSRSETITEVMALVDLVVIPVRPSPNDLRAVGGTIELAKRARRRMDVRRQPGDAARPDHRQVRDRAVTARHRRAGHDPRAGRFRDLHDGRLHRGRDRPRFLLGRRDRRALALPAHPADRGRPLWRNPKPRR